jgi:hypothetical protein
MLHLARRLGTAAGALLLLAACTTSDQKGSQPSPVAPSVSVTRPPSSPTPDPAAPTTFRYIVNDLQAVLPSTFGTHELQ